MQKTSILSISFLLCLTISFGQTIEFKASYKKETLIPYDRLEAIKEKNPKKYERYLFMLKRMAETSKQMNYTLLFKNGESLFRAEEILSKNPQAVKMHGSVGTYYNNFEQRIRLQQLEQGGELFLISRKPLQWNIKEETKTIHGFLCKKATAVRYFYSKNETKEQTIVVWFTPEISASSGPVGIDGLPGLILDLSVAGGHYYMTNIDSENKNISIEKPTKGIKVTYKEFQKKMNEVVEKFE